MQRIPALINVIKKLLPALPHVYGLGLWACPHLSPPGQIYLFYLQEEVVCLPVFMVSRMDIVASP